MKSITVQDETKERFDRYLASEIGQQKEKISADKFLTILIDSYRKRL